MPGKKYTILAADDDPQLLRLVTRNLQLEGYETLAASDGQQALDLIETQTPDLALLDVMMPRLDGFTVCERVREFSALPIIMLTARGQDQDKIRGLDLGADDYLTKPFSIEELLARVRAVLRRSQLTSAEDAPGPRSRIVIGDLALDLARHEVTMADQAIELTPIEFRLLAYLAQNAGRVITQDMLLDHVWGEGYMGETHLLQVNINRLRRKLEPDVVHPRYLLTKTGVGYLLATEPAPHP